jgi:hypothetical protein
MHGSLENMNWLKDNGCPCGAGIFDEAASRGKLENIKWLKENG